MNRLQGCVRGLWPFMRFGGVSVVAALAGCASYHPVPLPTGPHLAPDLAGLTLTVPDGAAPHKTLTLDPHRPISPAEIGMLAAVNNPELAYQRARIATARAKLRAGETLRNPSFGLGYAALISGPAAAGAVTASLTQDIRSIITYRARSAVSRHRFRQLSARVLWREWQIARRAQFLAMQIHFDNRDLAIRRRHERLLASQLAALDAAANAGNADLTAEAPIEAARATAQRGLAAARKARLKHWIALDGLLGLRPTARFRIARPSPARIPRHLQAMIATLPQRRPDIVALRMGYAASQARVRAAILTQFPPFSLGLAGGSDTSKVVSAGPQISVDLPVFHGAKARIGLERASRAELRKQYVARLDKSEAEILGLKARFDADAGLVSQARRAARLAAQRLHSAESAYGQDGIDQRTLVDFAGAAVERDLDLVAYERARAGAALALRTDLGASLPTVALNPPSGVMKK